MNDSRGELHELSYEKLCEQANEVKDGQDDEALKEYVKERLIDQCELEVHFENNSEAFAKLFIANPGNPFTEHMKFLIEQDYE